MKIASMIGGAFALGGGLVNLTDYLSGAEGGPVSSILLIAIGSSLLYAGYLGRQRKPMLD